MNRSSRKASSRETTDGAGLAAPRAPSRVRASVLGTGSEAPVETKYLQTADAEVVLWQMVTKYELKQPHDDVNEVSFSAENYSNVS